MQPRLDGSQRLFGQLGYLLEIHVLQVAKDQNLGEVWLQPVNTVAQIPPQQLGVGLGGSSIHFWSQWNDLALPLQVRQAAIASDGQ